MRAALLFAGCQLIGCDALGQSCTDMGCTNGFQLAIESRDGRRLPAGKYSGSVIADGAATTFECWIGADCSYGCTKGVDWFGPGCRSLVVVLPATPREIRIDWAYEGRSLGSGAWTPTYAVSRPNGPSCDPECQSAVGKLVVDVPACTSCDAGVGANEEDSVADPAADGG